MKQMEWEGNLSFQKLNIIESFYIITLKFLGYNAILSLNIYELIISLPNITMKYDS
jgi:hypothetical protein